MSQSPYLSQDLKDYLKFHNIESTLSNTVNELLRQKYDDPYSYMMNQFGNLASNAIKIIQVKAFQTLNSQGNPTIKTQFTVEYKLKTFDLVLDYQFAQGSENSQYLLDKDADGNEQHTMNEAIKLINNEINELIKNKQCSDQKSIDDSLQVLSDEKENKILNATLPISYGVPQVVSRIFHQQYYQVLRDITGFKVQEDQQSNVPKLMINLLQGSKVVGVKCKVYKFYLIVNQYETPQEAYDIAHEITLNIKKTICSGKQGEAALKYHTDGTFICSVDTIADNIKQIEEAINKTNYKDKVALGLSWMADNLYHEDKKTYELENPKQQFTTEQLIDYYVKLIQDKPIIQYMEDPIILEDTQGWSELINKMQETHPNVKIGSRHLYKDLSSIKESSENLQSEDYPDLSPEELEAKNNSRVHLHAQQYYPNDFTTLSKFLELPKYLSQKKPYPCSIIISDNMTDTLDTSIIDLAFSINDCYLNISSPLKYEKMIKYNRFIEILTLQQINQDNQQLNSLQSVTQRENKQEGSLQQI